MSSNRAAWQPAKKALQYEVRPAPYTAPGPNQILVKNRAVAINPADWILQFKGDLMFTWLKYPCILGSDVAGEVVEIGQDVTDFQLGDRVLGYAVGVDEKINSSAECAFQEYTILRTPLSTKVPPLLSYEAAAVIPLGLATAAAGLFQKDQLGLQLPTHPSRPATGQILIIWGGSTSVGCNAIQLGVAAGYEVLTTASATNHAYLKSLGASHIFDYRSTTVVEDILKVTNGRSLAGALTIGTGAAEACMSILDKSKPPSTSTSTSVSTSSPSSPSNNNLPPPTQKFISMATYPAPDPDPPANMVLLRSAASFLSFLAIYKTKGLLKGIRSNFIFATTVTHNEVGKAIFRDFLPGALTACSFVPAPEAEIVADGKGVDGIMEGLERQKAGVSCRKIVVTF